MFHNPDGTLKAGDPYDRTEYTRRVLCAWCSIPDSKKSTPEEVPLNVSETLLKYYIANKPDDSERCVLPITNIEAYLGSFSLSKSYILLLSGKVLERKAGTSNVCVARFNLPE